MACFRLNDSSSVVRDSDDGDDVAWDRIRIKLQELVDNEDKQDPYSDDDLVKELKKHGMKVARRTVTKYRQKMGIPSSRQRRDWSKRYDDLARGRTRPSSARRVGPSRPSNALDVQAAATTFFAADVDPVAGHFFHLVNSGIHSSGWDRSLEMILIVPTPRQSIDQTLFESHVIHVNHLDAIGNPPQNTGLVDEPVRWSGRSAHSICDTPGTTQLPPKARPRTATR